MTLPIDLILLRHGQSEGNLAKRMSEAGDPTAYDNLRKDRHTRSFRLTELGRQQAERAGVWIRKEFPHLDRFIVSEFARAMETAALLGLPGANWYSNFFLTERDWGEYDSCSEQEREERFGKALAMQDIEPFFWRPLNGESLSELCLRLHSLLGTLHRECGDKQVILVCHGEVMWAFRVLIERMSQKRFKELHLSKEPLDRIHNCQVLHYTRRDPASGRIAKHANWMRMVRPSEDPVWHSGWQSIVRPTYSNEELLAIVEGYPRVLE